MLDIGWSEILVIAVVAIVVFPSKDLPKLLRTVGQTVGRVRRMAGDFQSQFNAALREAEREMDLEETRKQIQSVKDANPLTDVKRALDPLRNAGEEIRRGLTAPPPASDPRPPVGAVAVPNEPVKTGAAGDAAASEPVPSEATAAPVEAAPVPAPAVAAAPAPVESAPAPAAPGGTPSEGSAR